ncbi:MAG: calcium-binding protein, partial [Burkholderiales bacterium]
MQSNVWYEFALQQVAAETYWDAVDLKNRTEVLDALELGNNNPGFSQTGFTRLTSTQAEEFIKRYKVVDHHPNDATGFSATLLYDTKENRYTLSFRSSEYRLPQDGGDFDRDVLGADTEINKYGLAFGQLDSMQRYFENLSSGKNWKGVQTEQLAQFKDLIASGGQINVTGYSLGGHLATVFTETHLTQVSAAYVFNSPGRGNLQGSLSAVLTYFRQVMNDPALAVGVPHNETYQKALAAANSPLPSNIYSDPRYRWAVLATSTRFHTVKPLLSSAGLGNGADAKIQSIYGKATHGDIELVANSGVHTSNKVNVFIEDQPDIQGLLGHLPGLWDWLNKLLAGKGDFGTTHSLALLIDSLALAKVIQATNSSLTIATVGQIFAAAADERAHGVLGTGTGTAEGSSLEKILDSLRKLFSGAAVASTRFDASEGGFGNYENRTLFQQNVSSLEMQVAGKPSAKVETLAGVSAGQLFSLAYSDVAYRYALKELIPFAVVGVPDLYTSFNNGGALQIYSPASAPEGQLTADYLTDRSDLLYWKNAKNIGDIEGTVRERGAKASDYEDRTSGLMIAVRNTSASFSSVVNIRKVIFGSDLDETGSKAIIGGAGDDRLYGGGGVDVLSAGAGRDYIEGNSGVDTLEGGDDDDILVGGAGDDILRGGKGVDTYVVGNDKDTINDEDGRGIVVDGNGRRIAGLFVKQGSQYVFVDDPNIVATRNSPLTITLENGARVVVENFDDGEFGIKLTEQPKPTLTPPDDTVIGTLNADDLFVPVGATAAYLLSAGASSDLLRGGKGNDTLNGDAGNDYLVGGKGDDDFFGGAGDDFILLGAGADYAEGGPGADFIGYWGFEFFPTLTLAVGGWPVNFRDGFSWGTTVLQNEANGYLEIGTVTLRGENAFGQSLEGVAPPTNEADPSYVGSFELLGGEGNDLIVGGPGNDTILGDDADDALLGQRGDDTMFGGVGNDLLAGNIGSDYLDGGPGDDTLRGEDGDDVLFGGSGTDVLYGDVNFADAPFENHGSDYLDGGEDADTLFGLGGDDTLFGGEGADVLYGDGDFVPEDFQGDDYLDGEDGNDILFGHGGDDELF